MPTGGFPQFVPQAYRQVVEKNMDRVKSKKTILVVADTLPVQIDLMKAGYSHGQVGQRPFDMGYKIDVLLEGPAREEESAGSDPIRVWTCASRRRWLLASPSSTNLTDHSILRPSRGHSPRGGRSRLCTEREFSGAGSGGVR